MSLPRRDEQVCELVCSDTHWAGMLLGLPGPAWCLETCVICGPSPLKPRRLCSPVAFKFQRQTEEPRGIPQPTSGASFRLFGTLQNPSSLECTRWVTLQRTDRDYLNGDPGLEGFIFSFLWSVLSRRQTPAVQIQPKHLRFDRCVYLPAVGSQLLEENGFITMLGSLDTEQNLRFSNFLHTTREFVY